MFACDYPFFCIIIYLFFSPNCRLKGHSMIFILKTCKPKNKLTHGRFCSLCVLVGVVLYPLIENTFFLFELNRDKFNVIDNILV